MTFNQWCSTQGFDPSIRVRLEAIWNEIVSAGNSGEKAGRLLEEAIDPICEFYREKYRRW
jgi:hypothetical protein